MAPTSVESVEAACSTFVHAATPEARKQAEAQLLLFRQSDDPLPLCVTLLELERSPHAQFHGLATLRERAHEKWPALDATARDALQLKLLQLIAGGAASSATRVASFVMREAAQVASLLAKLALLDAATSADSAAIFNGDAAGGGHGGYGEGGAGLCSILGRISELIAAPDISHAVVGVHVLESLVLEFGSPSCGAAGGGLRWAEHSLARRIFGRYHLLPAFYTGLRALERIRAQLNHSAAEAGISSPMNMILSPTTTHFVENCASVLGLILSWDFDSGPAVSEAGDSDSESRPGLNATIVRPPAESGDWAAVLGSTQLLSCVIEIYAAAARGGVAFSHARHALGQLLVMLSSVSHRVVGGGAVNASSLRAEYSAAVLAAACALMGAHPLVTAVGGAEAAGPLGPLSVAGPFDDATEEAEEVGCSLLNGATMLQRLVMASGIEGMLSLPKNSLFMLLAGAHNGAVATASAAADASASPVYERTREAEAHDVCVEVLSSLQLQSRAAGRGPHPSIDDASWRVYLATVRERRRAACASAELEAEEEIEEGVEGEEDEEDRLQALSTLGRARSGEACSLLTAALQECGAKWHAIATHVAAAGNAEEVHNAQLAALFEELMLLLQLASFLLTDPAEGGDAAEIPVAIAAASAPPRDSANGALAGEPATDQSYLQHPAIELVDAVLAQLRPHLEAILASADPRTGPLAPLLSPLVGKAFLQFGAKVARTYLMPDEAVVSVLPPVLLAKWGRGTAGGEALLIALAEAAAIFTLRWRGEEELALAGCELLAATCRRKGAAPLLGRLDCINQLASMPKSILTPSAAAMLHEALARVALASAQPEQAFGGLCEPLAVTLEESFAIATGTGRAATLHPQTVAQVHGACAGLRGLFAAPSRHTTVLVFSRAARCFQPMLNLFRMLETEPTALTPVLLTFQDAAATWMPTLPLPSALHLAQACAAAATAYAAIVRALPPPRAGGTAGVLPEIERCDQLRALLEMTTCVVLRDPNDDTLGEGAQVVSAAAAAAAAPLSEAASTLLQACLVCAPPSLLQFPEVIVAYFEMLGAVVEVHPSCALSLPAELCVGIDISLAAGITHYDITIGRAALETTFKLARHAGSADGRQSGPGIATLILRMLRRVALSLLAGALHPELVDPPAANALLALIAVAPDGWQGIVREVVGAQPNAEAQQATAQALGALLTSNGVSASLSKPNRTRFRANLTELLKFTRRSRFAVPHVPS